MQSRSGKNGVEMLIDTHTHLVFPDFGEDLEEVISRAWEAGVRKMIVPGIDRDSSREAVALSERFAPVYAAVGTHPQDSAAFRDAEMEWFREAVQHPKVVAVGEIGLDFYRDFAPKEQQKRVLRAFLELAAEARLPVILHNRRAFGELLALLDDFSGERLTGVFHCFSEGVREAQEVLRRGFLVSFTGTITFKKSRSAEVAAQIPLENQLLETDAPFMAPVPHRGKRNEPSFVRYVAQKQAELHALSVEEAARVTGQNAERLFARLCK